MKTILMETASEIRRHKVKKLVLILLTAIIFIAVQTLPTVNYYFAYGI